MGDIEQIRKQMPPLLEDILVRWRMFYNPNIVYMDDELGMRKERTRRLQRVAYIAQRLRW